MASDIFLYAIITLLSCVGNAQQFFGNNNNGYPSSNIPRGYQPPPSPPLLPQYYPPQQQHHSERQYQFGPFQPQFVVQRPTSVVPQTAITPAVAYPIDLPPKRNEPQILGINNNNSLQSNLATPPMRFIPDPRPPIIINTLIQVYVDGKRKTIGAPHPALEGKVVTGVANNERVVLTKEFDVKTQKFIEENGNPGSNHKHSIAVNGLAETNSTKIARDDLQKELEKELENSIPLILDELDKIKINKANMAKDSMMTENLNPEKSGNSGGKKQTNEEEVSIEDLEKLIREGLNELDDSEAKKQLEKEFKEVIEATTPPTSGEATTLSISTPSVPPPNSNQEVTEVATSTVAQVTHSGNMVIREMGEDEASDTESEMPSTLPPGIVTFVAHIESDSTTLPPSSDTTPKEAIVVVTPARAEMMVPIKSLVIKSKESIEREQEEMENKGTPEPAEMMAPEKAMTIESEEDVEADKQTPEPPEMIMPVKAMVIKSLEEEEASTHAPVTAEMMVPSKALIIESVEDQGDETVTIPITTTIISTTPTTPTTTTTTRSSFTTTPSTTTTSLPTTTEPPTEPPTTTTESTTVPPTTTEEITTIPTTELITTEPETTTEPSTTEATTPEITTTEETTITTSSTSTTTTTSATTTTITLPFASEQCEIPNDESETLKGDVLFLLDSSTSIGNKTFHKAVQLVKQIVLNFANIGPKGVQFALIQYNREPWLEFTFRRHTCLSLLLEDIEDTEWMNGPSNLGRALNKVMKFAFTPARGDRPDAENIVVLVTDGFSEDQVNLPITLSRQNGTTPIVVAALQAKKDILIDIAEGDESNMFNLTEAIHKPLGEQLAQRIKDILRAGPAESEEEATTDLSTTSLALTSTTPGKGVEEETGETVQMMHEVEPSSMEMELTGAPIVPMIPKEDDSVKVQCTGEGISAQFEVGEAFGGVIVARGYSNTSKCSVQIPQINKNSKAMRAIPISMKYAECGVTVMKSDLPRGVNYSVVLNLLHNKEIVTARDKSYIIQCFRPTGVINSTLQTQLDITGNLPITKTISLTVAPPKCHYSLRQDTLNGPIVEKARIGQVIYHRWECEGENITNSVYGLYIHDCRATNNTKADYSIINENGCSADSSIVNEIIYANDKLLAFAKSYVFTLTDVSRLLFTCKVSLCVRDGDGCEGYSPPVCASINTSTNDVLLTRRVRNYDGALESALTSELSTTAVDVSDPFQAIRFHQLHIPVAIAVVIALLLGSLVGVIWHFCQAKRPKKFFASGASQASTFPDDESTTDKSETLSFRSLDFRTPEERSMDLSEIATSPPATPDVRR